MRTSESIKEIAAALSKAQGAMTGAKKGADNPFFKSKYADLAEVIKALSEPFAANGLSFIQSAGFVDGKISVTTRIMHSSGEWLESDPCELPPVKNDPQAYGSAISYAKRYSLQSFAGVPSIDDDGNEAVKQVKRIDKKLVQEYVNGFLVAIETEDGLACRELSDEIKDTPEMDAVWSAFNTKQKQIIKSLLHGARDAA